MELNEFLRVRDSGLSLELSHINQLAECLNLSLSHFLKKSIDFGVLKKHFKNEDPVLPQHYSSNAFGTMTSFRGMMQYLALTNPLARKLILAELQLDSRLLSQSKLPVNIQMYEDASQKMAGLGLDLDSFRAMGWCAGRENLKNLDFNRLSKDYTTLRPLERILRVAIGITDTNHIYKIEKISDGCAWFSSYPTEKIQDATGRKLVGNIFTSVMKETIIGSIPGFLGEKKPYTTTLIQNIHSGGNSCLYEIKAS